MPKLSLAKRHRKQLNLAACCCNDPLVQTPRKVSDEDIHQDYSFSSVDSQEAGTEHDQNPKSKPCLKRPAPSTCLTQLLQEELISTPPPSASRSFPSMQLDSEEQEDADGNRISPIWGHFVDIILEQEESDSAGTVTPAYQPQQQQQPVHPQSAPAALGGEHEHRPYFFKRRRGERKRILSPSSAALPPPLAKGGTQSPPPQPLREFVLQDPSTLPDALARLRV